MNIAIISTSPTGGAGIAAYRLHHGLCKIGINSHFIHCSRKLDEPNIVNIPSVSPSKIDNLLYRLGIPKLAYQKRIKILNKIQPRPSLFTFPFSDYPELHLIPEIQNADIINVHWAAGFIDYPSFFANIKKPIVLTLHDMNAFKGGFHYHHDEEENISNFERLNQDILSIKKKAYDSIQHLSIVTPSLWLTKCSQESPLLGKQKHLTIPYGINTETFKYLNPEFCRIALNLPIDKKIILGVASDLNDKRKGFDLVHKSINDLPENTILLTVGKKIREQNHFKNVIQLGEINDYKLMPIVYNAADAVILPSREDNLPNVMIEALCCGTPVISFNIGGMIETIQSGKNGIHCGPISQQNLFNGILQFIKTGVTLRKEEIANESKLKFDMTVQATNYVKTFAEI